MMLSFTLLLVPMLALAQTKRAMTFDDLISFGRVSDPQVSPDGKTIAFVVTWQLKEENKSASNIYLVPVAGGAVKQLTNAKGQNNNPRWMPDGKSIAFVSTRDDKSQIWVIPTDSGEVKKISNIATEASGLIVSPDGKWFAFNSSVFPECKDEESNAKKLKEVEDSKVKAKIFTHLPFRIWNEYKDGKRNHLFVMPSDGGKATDLTPGDFDTPPIDLGGSVDYAFSPDCKEIVFTRNPDAMVAISTNNELYAIPITGGLPAVAGEPKNITNNPANDNQPVYSPDGKYVAYRMMRRAGFEADKQEITLYERATGKKIFLTEDQDYSAGLVVWSPDAKSLYWTAEDKGNVSIFKTTVNNHTTSKLYSEGFITALQITPDGNKLIFVKERATLPAEIFSMDLSNTSAEAGKNVQQLSFINKEKTAPLAMNPIEPFWFKGAGGTNVQGFLLKPPAFDASKKYPLIYLVHGGPQNSWTDEFHYRWNIQMFASRGYVVVAVNPRGSTGYGQKFTDEISRDWGGKVYEDLMKGLDYTLATFPFIDTTRMAAAGASYGGYMMNWFLGHTNRFKAIVSHDGTFSPFSNYGTTEELWFDEWEFGGTPYEHPELFT
ncbi:MAG TPA: S9 family peptidase, partial [Bacteroidota bacterium]|nr:S9 family peptidase [Bacteroidota bacterium]